MEYVQIPLNIAQRAARVYRPLLPYVRKFIVSQREEKKDVTVIDYVEIPDVGDFILNQFKEVETEYNKKTKAELCEIAKDVGMKNPERLTKENLIQKLLGQQ
jgi:hypothetical protein